MKNIALYVKPKYLILMEWDRGGIKMIFKDGYTKGRRNLIIEFEVDDTNAEKRRFNF